MKAPRLMVTGKNGSGKSTVIEALIAALVSKGLRVRPACCSPEFRQIRRLESFAQTYAACLDIHLCGESSIVSLLSKAAMDCDATVIEGYWDIADDQKNDKADHTVQIAKLTDTSAVYVLDGREENSAQSIIEAYQTKGKSIPIAGIVFSHTTADQYRAYSQYVHDQIGLRSFGFLDERIDLPLSLESTLNIDGLLKLMRSAEALEVTCKEMGVCSGCGACDEMSFVVSEEPIPIALAFDKAFDAYYHQGLKRIEQMGVRFLPFSPLNGEAVPTEAKGMMLCGSAELTFIAQLNAQTEALRSIGQSAKRLPVWAEGIGAAVLCEKICLPDTTELPMSGAINGYAVDLKSMAHTGYASLGSKNTVANGLHVYENRCFDLVLSEHLDSDNSIFSVNSEGKSSLCGIVTSSSFIISAHLHPYGCESQLRGFVKACSKR